jgi:hypothetical protein
MRELELLGSTRYQRYILALYEGRITGRLYTAEQIAFVFDINVISVRIALGKAQRYERSVNAHKHHGFNYLYYLPT